MWWVDLRQPSWQLCKFCRHEYIVLRRYNVCVCMIEKFAFLYSMVFCREQTYFKGLIRDYQLKNGWMDGWLGFNVISSTQWFISHTLIVSKCQQKYCHVHPLVVVHAPASCGRGLEGDGRTILEVMRRRRRRHEKSSENVWVIFNGIYIQKNVS